MSEFVCIYELCIYKQEILFYSTSVLPETRMAEIQSVWILFRNT